MADTVAVRGMVLKHRAVGDYDWAVTLLTLERGKISAFARGARRPNAHLAGSVEPFSFGTFHVYPGKSSYSIAKAEIETYFEGLRTDLAGACYGTFFLEIADYYARENNDERALLKLLYQSLRALSAGKEMLPARLVRVIFELKALGIAGEYPGVPEGDAWSGTLRYTCDYIQATPVEKLYSFTVSEQVLTELARLAALFRARFMDRKPKSLEMLAAFEPADTL